MSDDQRPQQMMNAIAGSSPILVGALVLGGGLAYWLLLMFTYSLDRPDIGAYIGASMNVLLVVPTLVSYYLTMGLTHRRLPLLGQLLCVVGVGFIWLFVQRLVIYPAFGLTPEYGENLTNFLFVSFFGVCAWLARQSFLFRARLAEAERLQQQAELDMLGAQLAPHTLFNMTNRVYAVLLENPEKAAPLFLSMTNMLRHLVERTRKKWVSLNDELAFMEDYAAIQRAHGQTEITIESSGDIYAPVPPMLIATLFENAVKHGRSAEGELRIEAELKVEDDRILFDMKNSRGESQDGMGVGLQNLRRRLQLLYPGNYQLIFERFDNHVRTHLEISQ